jgi:hypothetical protein
MPDARLYPLNPETHGTTPIQFFEADDGPASPDTKPSDRPADRPRELPPADILRTTWQLFESQQRPAEEHHQATPRPGGRDSNRV